MSDGNTWVSVLDSMPKNRLEILFYIEDLNQIELGHYNEDMRKWVMPFRDDEYGGNDGWVTHWMELPKCPQ